jgi:hypothetical protein
MVRVRLALFVLLALLLMGGCSGCERADLMIDVRNFTSETYFMTISVNGNVVIMNEEIGKNSGRTQTFLKGVRFRNLEVGESVFGITPEPLREVGDGMPILFLVELRRERNTYPSVADIRYFPGDMRYFWVDGWLKKTDVFSMTIDIYHTENGETEVLYNEFSVI